jgi:hypothetical protein
MVWDGMLLTIANPMPLLPPLMKRLAVVARGGEHPQHPLPKLVNVGPKDFAGFNESGYYAQG